MQRHDSDMRATTSRWSWMAMAMAMSMAAWDFCKAANDG